MRYEMMDGLNSFACNKHLIYSQSASSSIKIAVRSPILLWHRLIDTLSISQKMMSVYGSFASILWGLSFVTIFNIWKRVHVLLIDSRYFIGGSYE